MYNDIVDYREGHGTKAAASPPNAEDVALMGIVPALMREDVDLSLQQQAYAYAKIPYRRNIFAPLDAFDDVILPADKPKPTPLNSFLSWFKKG